jgi:large subunit ribosomal protein L25
METVEITIERRSQGGKGAARRLRRAGSIPAVFYGPERATTAVSMRAEEFEHKLTHLEGSHLIRLLATRPDDRDLHDKMALVREVQRHPVTDRVLHIDFYEVDLTARLTVSVPLRFVGKAAGVVAGGILQPVLREIEVDCLPTEIPEFIEVDVSRLGIHEAVHVSDVRLPEGVVAVTSAGKTLVTVLPPTVEEAKPAAEAAEAAPAEGAAAEAAAGAPAEGASPGGKKGEAGASGGKKGEGGE